MADNIEHQDKGELVTNCDRFNSFEALNSSLISSVEHCTYHSYSIKITGRSDAAKMLTFPSFFSKI